MNCGGSAVPRVPNTVELSDLVFGSKQDACYRLEYALELDDAEYEEHMETGITEVLD